MHPDKKQDTTVDVASTLIDATKEEFDDVHDDQFGRPFSGLYKDLHPQYDRMHAKALAAVERLKRRFANR